jgi:hypothetical protein
MKPCRLLLLTAVYPEARALARAFRCPDYHRGIFKTGDIAIAAAGIRAPQAPALLASIEPQFLVITGLAGALAPHLKVGDIVSQGPLPPLAPNPFSILTGDIHTSPTLLETPALKAALHARTGALAVDMETQIVSELAHRQGIPFHALRAISDAAHDPLDPNLFSLVDRFGRPRTTRLAALLLRHPSALSRLLRIKRATDLAMANLSSLLRQLTLSGWPDNCQFVRSTPTTFPSPEDSAKAL